MKPRYVVVQDKVGSLSLFGVNRWLVIDLKKAQSVALFQQEADSKMRAEDYARYQEDRRGRKRGGLE